MYCISHIFLPLLINRKYNTFLLIFSLFFDFILISHRFLRILSSLYHFIIMMARLSIFLIMFFALSCNDGKEPDRVHSAYYWTTTFRMSEKKTRFLNNNDIRRLYVRFFDVVMTEQQGAMPNATIEFIDTIPQGLEIVPTVFVMNECMAVKQDALPGKIVERVIKMCQAHDIHGVRELQIDCDWTARTEQNYFRFLNEVRTLLREKGMSLSVTIRLHQLSMKTPPADRGILMVYNTGDVTDPECHNPILNVKDVRPYLSHARDYELELSAAYPVFSWNVLFRGKHFVGIQHFEGEYPTMSGDTLVNYRPEPEEILQVKRELMEKLPDANREIILYDLSDKNLENYSQNDFHYFYE